MARHMARQVGMPVILPLDKQKQEDWEFKVICGYAPSSSPAWDT